jgi:hypothetical protein
LAVRGLEKRFGEIQVDDDAPRTAGLLELAAGLGGQGL